MWGHSNQGHSLFSEETLIFICFVNESMTNKTSKLKKSYHTALTAHTSNTFLKFGCLLCEMSVSKMAILAIVSMCALSVIFSLEEVMVWDAMSYPTIKFLAVNIVSP